MMCLWKRQGIMHGWMWGLIERFVLVGGGLYMGMSIALYKNMIVGPFL